MLQGMIHQKKYKKLPQILSIKNQNKQCLKNLDKYIYTSYILDKSLHQFVKKKGGENKEKKP